MDEELLHRGFPLKTKTKTGEANNLVVACCFARLFNCHTLATKFPEETLPETGKELSFNFITDPKVSKIDNSDYIIDAPGAIGSFRTDNMPNDYRITLQIDPKGSNDELGLFLRATNKASEGYKLSFSASKQIVWLGNTKIEAVSGLDKPFTVDIIVKGDIFDVCINNQRCIVNRLPERKGNSVWFFIKQGKAEFKNIKIYPIQK